MPWPEYAAYAGSGCCHDFDAQKLGRTSTEIAIERDGEPIRTNRKRPDIRLHERPR
jgi:hypothetical protein